MQRMWSCAETRYFKRSRPLLRVSRQAKVSQVSPVPRPYLYSDGDGTICNARVKKSTQRGGSSVYKALRETLEQHIIDGGDDQRLKFFIHSNDEEIRQILQNALDVHK